MSMRNNCSCYTKNNRKCKNKKFHIINNKNFCYIHAQKKFYNYALIIQTSWITYKKNKNFQIYSKLPIDIQDKIKLEIHKDYYFEKLLKKFLINKIKYILEYNVNKHTMDNYLMYNFDKIYDNYSYIIKYKSYIEDKYILKLEYITKLLNTYCLNIYYGGDIDTNYISEFLDTELFTHEIREKYNKFSNQLYEFYIWLKE
tara:strand:+ start:2971 stop:3570 length:600 start_codon:yes stop_codon:yes gene_type:complete